MYGCEWFRVYDIIEALHATFSKNDGNNDQQDALHFADELNGFFIEEGIGWQLVDGQIKARGTEALRRP